jgi:negative regulator of replication initiation
MRTHQVEVDDEVFSFVKGRAEPLVDNFNSALRRLLPLGEAKTQRRAQSPKPDHPINGGTHLSSLPNGTPQALRQILEVAQLVRGGAYTRTAATQYVAKQHRVFQQTVLDKYCRQLNLTANQFDRLLEQDKLPDLRQVLRSKFPDHAEVINGALD